MKSFARYQSCKILKGGVLVLLLRHLKEHVFLFLVLQAGVSLVTEPLDIILGVSRRTDSFKQKVSSELTTASDLLIKSVRYLSLSVKLVRAPSIRRVFQ